MVGVSVCFLSPGYGLCLHDGYVPDFRPPPPPPFYLVSANTRFFRRTHPHACRLASLPCLCLLFSFLHSFSTGRSESESESQRRDHARCQLCTPHPQPRLCIYSWLYYPSSNVCISSQRRQVVCYDGRCYDGHDRCSVICPHMTQ